MNLRKNDVRTTYNRVQSTVQERDFYVVIYVQFGVTKNMMSELNEAQNKECERYSSCLLG